MKFCKNCGTQQKDGTTFCGTCGASTAPAENKTAKKKPVALIGALTAAVVITGIVATMLLSGGTSSGTGGETGGKTKTGTHGGEIEEVPSGPRQVPNAARMKNELSKDGRSFIPATQIVDIVDILSEETGKEDELWVHHATVLVNSSDSELAYVKYGALTYQRNEEMEWVLTNMTAERMELWTVSPLTGVKESFIESSVREALLWQSVTIDGEDWRIDENTLEEIKVNSQKTSLENRRDTVIVTVVLGSEAKTAEGQIELEFVFNDSAWSLGSHRGNAPFKSIYRPAAVFELTNDQLLNELVRNDATVLREFNWAGQTITITRDEISGLKIHDYESSNKGAKRVYNFSFDLDKDIVDFEVDAQVSYSFDSLSGWALGDFTFTAVVTSNALEGTRWTGITLPWFPDSNQRHVNMEILEVANDGAVRVRISATERTAVSTLIGFINFNDLSVKLNFEEWIIRPDVHRDSQFRYTVDPLIGHILINDSQIYSPRTFYHAGVRVTLTDEIAEVPPTVDLDEPVEDDINEE